MSGRKLCLCLALFSGNSFVAAKLALAFPSHIVQSRQPCNDVLELHIKLLLFLNQGIFLDNLHSFQQGTDENVVAKVRPNLDMFQILPMRLKRNQFCHPFDCMLYTLPLLLYRSVSWCK